jgi:hypothetical protein
MEMLRNIKTEIEYARDLAANQIFHMKCQGNRTRFATEARNYIVTMFKALRTSSR